MPQQPTMREIVDTDKDLTTEQKRAAWAHLMGGLMYMDQYNDMIHPAKIRSAVKAAIEFAKAY